MDTRHGTEGVNTRHFITIHYNKYSNLDSVNITWLYNTP
ncbi:hypothetical protein E2C01_060996 [Portunus trituberculatus]|uniref:Uncharacterized protein n=1 Tax=Portunus trituberculatus TaxID=210409 RepID=A0A5B7H2P3_PORTR|nr:hypothetical protein [Portunus trituberculatus]